MRLFTRRPVLAALLLLGLAGVASGAVYAVDRVFLEVDPEKPPEELERDVKAQLESAGVKADVTAHKRSDDGLELRVTSDDKSLPDRLEFVTPSRDADIDKSLQLDVNATCQLTDAEQAKLAAAASSPGMVQVLVGNHDRAKTIELIKREFATSGFRDVDVKVTDEAINITVKSPPAP